jgi:ribosomal-protein-alanine N-acetyltransferase
MIRIDMLAVVEIENESFATPWSEEEFIRCLRERNCIGMVAEQDDQILGFMVYELHKNRLHILDFAVRKGCRKQGVGRRLFDKLIQKLRPTGRSRVLLEVRETNLDAQLFFRAIGCKCVSTLREFYDDTDEDAYVMQYRYKSLAESVNAQSPNELAG